ncbi:Holliday junction resolvase RecU [Oceanobacillus sp. M65]|uniref:Holliday junction resolvase RecU n=1 Tax=Oceanobacillus jordanicus TaxID=2867266 RepID=A0AAW5B6J7_9BACI|nr:Holliday junction resolvase RecU [Oceanobacillus jordanicus]MCG3418877.1 Holliday junction resolvase RecU [Oceanobacillus jordanicus]
MNYPNGKKGSLTQPSQSRPSGAGNHAFSNRGMTLEEDINETNRFYLDTDKAIIHKKPTPVQIVKVNYPKRSAAVITEAYFKQASTTDYNGVYRSKHIDFEAKETKNKTLFPLANIHNHQVAHMRSVVEHGGICFLLIRFTLYQETYFLPAEKLFQHWDDKLKGGRKSISYDQICQEGHQIPFQYQARIDYLAIIDKLYF